MFDGPGVFPSALLALGPLSQEQGLASLVAQLAVGLAALWLANQAVRACVVFYRVR